MPPENLRPNNLEKARDYWDKEGERGWREDEGPDPFFNQFCAQHKSELGRDVLDVGSGNGRYVMPLARDGFNVTGLDLSEGMISAAQRRLAEQNLRANFVKGQSAELPFGDGSFDFVISTGAIHHNNIEGVRGSFKEINRVLKPEKYFLFMGRSVNDDSEEREITEDMRGQGLGFTGADRQGIKKDIAQHYFSAEELRQLGEEYGFEITAEPHEQLRAAETPDKKTARIWAVYKKRE